MNNTEQIVVKVAIPKLLCPRIFQILSSMEPRSRAEKIRYLAYLGELLESGVLFGASLTQNKAISLDSDFPKATDLDNEAYDLAVNTGKEFVLDINDFADYID